MLAASGLRQRSALLQAARSYFIEQGYLEVDTPIRLPTCIPEANIVPIYSEGWFLQTSPEQCMKRLMAGGCSQLFQICHCFRAGERGRWHHPEFTMLEWYHAGWNYTDMMRECETFLPALFAEASARLNHHYKGTLEWRGQCVALMPPWERLTVQEAFQRYAPCAVEQAVADGLFDQILVELIEPELGLSRPTFLYDYPAELASLARLSMAQPNVAERFELYIAGLEIANGFSELVDPAEQRRRFAKECEIMRQNNLQVALPERFLDDLAGLGETAGTAMGFDRILMLFLGETSIDKVLPFIYEEL